MRTTGQYSSIMDLIRKLYQSEGWRVFYRGYLANSLGGNEDRRSHKRAWSIYFLLQSFPLPVSTSPSTSTFDEYIERKSLLSKNLVRMEAVLINHYLFLSLFSRFIDSNHDIECQRYCSDVCFLSTLSDSNPPTISNRTGKHVWNDRQDLEVGHGSLLQWNVVLWS